MILYSCLWGKCSHTRRMNWSVTDIITKEACNDTLQWAYNLQNNKVMHDCDTQLHSSNTDGQMLLYFIYQKKVEAGR
jgi:hypothetical protein